MIKQFINDIINLIYPAECHLCGKKLAPNEKFICVPCIETLPRTGYHRSLRNPMEERFAGKFPFVKATGHFFYTRDSVLAHLIQDMKYHNFPTIGNIMGEIAGKELYTTGFFNDIEYIVPLPMHFMKKARRGYNQTDRIAMGLSKATDLKIIDAIKMVRQRKSQTSLTRTQRIENAKNLFKVRESFNLNGKGVLLIDDICTTGTTMGAAAEVLTEKFPDIKLSLFALGVTF